MHSSAASQQHTPVNSCRMPGAQTLRGPCGCQPQAEPAYGMTWQLASCPVPLQPMHAAACQHFDAITAVRATSPALPVPTTTGTVLRLHFSGAQCCIQRIVAPCPVPALYCGCSKQTLSHLA